MRLFSMGYAVIYLEEILFIFGLEHSFFIFLPIYAYKSFVRCHSIDMGVIDIKTMEINSQPFVIDSDIEKGFLKGSLWENLYLPYKFKVDRITNLSDFEKALYMLEVYSFTSIELTLYLATHPNSKEAFDMLKKVNSEKEKICEFIESKFSALSSYSEVLNGFFDLKMPWSEK